MGRLASTRAPRRAREACATCLTRCRHGTISALSGARRSVSGDARDAIRILSRVTRADAGRREALGLRRRGESCKRTASENKRRSQTQPTRRKRRNPARHLSLSIAPRALHSRYCEGTMSSGRKSTSVARCMASMSFSSGSSPQPAPCCAAAPHVDVAHLLQRAASNHLVVLSHPRHRNAHAVRPVHLLSSSLLHLEHLPRARCTGHKSRGSYSFFPRQSASTLGSLTRMSSSSSVCRPSCAFSFYPIVEAVRTPGGGKEHDGHRLAEAVELQTATATAFMMEAL